MTIEYQMRAFVPVRPDEEAVGKVREIADSLNDTIGGFGEVELLSQGEAGRAEVVLDLDVAGNMSSSRAADAEILVLKLSPFVKGPTLLECSSDGEVELLYLGPPELEQLTRVKNCFHELLSGSPTLNENTKEFLKSLLD